MICQGATRTQIVRNSTLPPILSVLRVGCLAIWVLVYLSTSNLFVHWLVIPLAGPGRSIGAAGADSSTLRDLATPIRSMFIRFGSLGLPAGPPPDQRSIVRNLIRRHSGSRGSDRGFERRRIIKHKH